jgi:hypothetical protein
MNKLHFHIYGVATMDDQCWMSLHACYQGIIFQFWFPFEKVIERVNFENLIKIIIRTLLTQYYKIWVQFTSPYST